jgi:hypothetical protein
LLALFFIIIFGAKTFEATVQTSKLAGFIAEKYTYINKKKRIHLHSFVDDAASPCCLLVRQASERALSLTLPHLTRMQGRLARIVRGQQACNVRGLLIESFQTLEETVCVLFLLLLEHT